MQSKGGTKAPAQSSAKVHSPAGSGSRPGGGKYPIKTSAPANPQTLDRNPPKSL